MVIELLLNKNDKDFPDVAIVVTEIENLKRNLLLFTQIKDLGIPAILAINMADRMKRKAISLDVELLEEKLKTKIALISSRKNIGFERLKDLISKHSKLSTEPCLNASSIAPEYFDRLRKVFPNQDLYKLWLVITQDVNFGKLDRKELTGIASFKTESKSNLKRLQQKETIARYQFINGALKATLTIDKANAKDLRGVLDRILIHKVWGYVVFFGILLLMFQAIFDWSSYPMDFIDASFASLSEWTKHQLPEGDFTSLIAEGIIPGLGGLLSLFHKLPFYFSLSPSWKKAAI